MPKTGRPRVRFTLSDRTLAKLHQILSLTGGRSDETVDRIVEEWCDLKLKEMESHE